MDTWEVEEMALTGAGRESSEPQAAGVRETGSEQLLVLDAPTHYYRSISFPRRWWELQ